MDAENSNDTADRRNRKTQNQYAARARALIRQYRAVAGDEQSVQGLVGWLIARRRAGLYANATWRQYRAAINATLPGMGYDTSALFDKDVRPPPPDRDARRRKRRVKAIGVGGRAAFEEALTRMRKRRATLIRAWMEAGIRTGLRPSEWETAILDTSGAPPILTVQNAKRSNGRGHGPLRRLALQDAETVYWVQEHLRAVREAILEGGFARYYRQSRLGLAAAYRRAGIRHGPSLYSARHQFKIDAMAAGVSRWDLAYLMGHGSTLTAHDHYGRGGTRTNPFTVAPARAPDDPEPDIREHDPRIRFAPRPGRVPDSPGSSPGSRPSSVAGGHDGRTSGDGQ